METTEYQYGSKIVFDDKIIQGDYWRAVAIRARLFTDPIEITCSCCGEGVEYIDSPQTEEYKNADKAVQEIIDSNPHKIVPNMFKIIIDPVFSNPLFK